MGYEFCQQYYETRKVIYTHVALRNYQLSTVISVQMNLEAFYFDSQKMEHYEINERPIFLRNRESASDLPLGPEAGKNLHGLFGVPERGLFSSPVCFRLPLGRLDRDDLNERSTEAHVLS